MNILGWTFNEFCAYTMLCIASADRKVSEEELLLLHDFLVSKEMRCPDKLINELSIVIKYQTESERISTISNYFIQFVRSSEQADLLVDLVEEMIVSDFKVDVNEMDVYRIVKKIARESF